MCILMLILHWFWFQGQKDLERDLELLSSLKNRIFGFMGQNGLSRSPCVGTAFREFEHVRMTDMFIVDVWLCRK